jgi:hypothetical protein
MQNTIVISPTPLAELIPTAPAEQLKTIQARDDVQTEADAIESDFLPQKKRELAVAEHVKKDASAKLEAAQQGVKRSKDQLAATPRVSRIGVFFCGGLCVVFAVGDYGVSLVLAKLFDIEVPFVAFAFVLCCSLLPAILDLLMGAVWGIDLSKRVESSKQRAFLGAALLVNLALIAVLGYLRGLALIAVNSKDGVEFSTWEKALIQVAGVLIAVCVGAGAAFALCGAVSIFRAASKWREASLHLAAQKAEEENAHAEWDEATRIVIRLDFETKMSQEDVSRMAKAHAAHLRRMIDARDAELKASEAEKQRAEEERVRAMTPLERMKHEAGKQGVPVPEYVN